MVLSVFGLRNQARFDWSRSGFGYDYFRYNINYNGVGQGQADMKIDTDDPNPHIWTILQGWGEYEFTAKGCNSVLLGSDDCPQGWAAPVRLEFGPVPDVPDPGEPAVSGRIEVRWHELGASSGPLGKPIAEERVASDGSHHQDFERGEVATCPAMGETMVLAAYQRGSSIELNWGGTGLSYSEFTVTAELDGRPLEAQMFSTASWPQSFARADTGGGIYALVDPKDQGLYRFWVQPSQAPGVLSAGVAVQYVWLPLDALLSTPPADGSPAQAFATHQLRVSDIAGHYAITRPLRPTLGTEVRAGENETLQFFAHLRAVLEDPDFAVPGELPSRLLFSVQLRLLHRGQMGTDFHQVGIDREGDYDMAVKGLMTIAYRYRDVLSQDDLDFILDQLIPAQLHGRHDPDIEFWKAAFVLFHVAETENHILMIETSRYLVNQLLKDRTADAQYDNNTNGLTGWLLGYLQRLAKFDFMEFNSRIYQRLALHAILNLYEFARDEPIRTAAHIVLDYIAVKFSVSSNRHRRIGPFRRTPDNVNSTDSDHSALLLNAHGDQVAGFALMWTGPSDSRRQPTAWFPRLFEFHALIFGLSSYRPPTAAYQLLLDEQPAVQHRFYHGHPPRVTASPDDPDGGVEIYYQSPSFMLTVGGMVLNSGYGHDEFFGCVQCAKAQSTTLMPTRGVIAGSDPAGTPLAFGDLIRFDPFLDIDVGDVNVGVHLNFACGTNLQIPDLWLNRPSTVRNGAWTFLNLDVAEGGLERLGFYVALYRTEPADEVLGRRGGTSGDRCGDPTCLA